MNKTDNLISRLDFVKQCGEGRWMARCPAHNDRSPSLRVTEATDGRILVHCFSGCGTESVLKAVGLQFSDLFPDEIKNTKGFIRNNNQQLSVDELTLKIAEFDRKNGKKLSQHDQEIERQAFIRLHGGAK